jgi:23S rRNA (uridine2552-2'-O)-methyltransferase
MYVRRDHYWHKAKREGYRSRAAYKLTEIQRRYGIFRRGDVVVDLGCAPGGWVQVIAREVGSTGRVIGVDRDRVEPFPDPWVVLLEGDLTDADFQKALRTAVGGPAQAVTCDMSPDLSGVGFGDHVRSCELVRCACRFAREILVPGGTFLCKIFQGEELEGVVSELKQSFREVKRIVPPASRKASSEIYLLARGYRPGPR